MKCNNCGAENANGAAFCYNCGSSIAGNPQPQTAEQAQSVQQTQPQYAPEQTQYGYQQPQYGYEQPQYGYEQPQYGYEQTQYGYEQTQQLYEQPDKPKKSGKKGTLIAVLIIVLLLVILGVFGYLAYENGWFDDVFSNEQTQEAEEPQGPEMVNLVRNKLYERGNIELWLSECKNCEGAVMPSHADKDYITPIAEDKDSRYFVFCIRVKNLSNKDIDFDNVYLSGSLDDEYDISNNFNIYYETADGTEFVNDSIIEPNETKSIYLVCTVSNEFANTCKKMKVSFGCDSDFSSKPATKGKKACDYIFEILAVQ